MIWHTLQKENSFKSQIKNYTTIALVKLQKQSITKRAKNTHLKKPEARYSSVTKTQWVKLSKTGLILIFEIFEWTKVY